MRQWFSQFLLLVWQLCWAHLLYSCQCCVVHQGFASVCKPSEGSWGHRWMIEVQRYNQFLVDMLWIFALAWSLLDFARRFNSCVIRRALCGDRGILWSSLTGSSVDRSSSSCDEYNQLSCSTALRRIFYRRFLSNLLPGQPLDCLPSQAYPWRGYNVCVELELYFMPPQLLCLKHRFTCVRRRPVPSFSENSMPHIISPKYRRFFLI